MTATAVLELKQQLCKLSPSERKQVSAYLLRLKHESPAWKKELGRRMKAMDTGKKIKLADTAKKLGLHA
jgi:hypothetical protein